MTKNYQLVAKSEKLLALSFWLLIIFVKILLLENTHIPLLLHHDPAFFLRKGRSV